MATLVGRTALNGQDGDGDAIKVKGALMRLGQLFGSPMSVVGRL